jgi:hypothetical protein
VVKGINVVTLHWTDRTSIIPLDFKVYDHEHDGKTKNDYFQDMLNKAKERGLELHCVLFESWHSSMGNLKLLTRLHWHFLTRLKSNRLVKQEVSDYMAVSEVAVPEEGCEVHLRESRGRLRSSIVVFNNFVELSGVRLENLNPNVAMFSSQSVHS